VTSTRKQRAEASTDTALAGESAALVARCPGGAGKVADALERVATVEVGEVVVKGLVVKGLVVKGVSVLPAVDV